MDLDQDIYWRIQQQNQEMEREMMDYNGANGSGSNGGAFDPLEHTRASSSALDPSAFSGNFHLPRFASGGPAGSYGYGMAIAEPERPRDVLKSTYPTMLSSNAPSPSGNSCLFSSIYRPPVSSTPSPAPLPQSNDSSFRYDPTRSANTPVFTPYGSSIVSINPSAGSYKVPSLPLPSSTPSSIPFDPAALSLPVPPPAGTSTNFAGLYSSSGFDMLSVLARVAARPHQTIQIGPVDTSCAFLVVDARKWDMPIVFASETFTRMTGYTCQEIIGRNCRFLQSPDGITTQGAPRKYTDGNAAWHMRTHISAGKESQSSLINYMKGGKPFINLVTIVPITWDSEDIAYYVGFQVDLVDQPNAILDRMKDGTYVVNYSLLNAPPKSISMASVEPAEVEEVWVEEKPVVGVRPGNLQLEVDGDEREVLETLGMLEKGGLKSLETEADRKQLNKLLLDNSDDFIHVLSLKGSMLYCSPSTAQVLEYEPSELIGKTLSALCHPSDVVPVMRELKDSGSISHPIVTLLYRIRRKHSGYIWIEASGKLHIEPGKGRKCVILVGRPREVFKMSWNELRRAGGLGDVEFWTKLSPEGMVLSSTASVQTVLGFLPTEMVGTSIFQLVKAENVAAVRQALRTCEAGSAVTVRYQIKSRRGFVEVVTRFYPRHVDPVASDMPIDYEVENNGPRHVSIIAQTNEISSEDRKHRKGTFLHDAPAYHSPGDSPMSETSTTSSAPRPMQSTFKTLSHPSVISDNVFDELDTTRCTSWQYELHQLQNINKKLRDEKEHLLSLQRKRRNDFDQLNVGGRRRGESASSRASSNRSRSCANCARTDSPEWRAGPTGSKSLCNACGLRWAKTQRSSASVSSAASAAAKSPTFSPYESMESSVSPAQWR